MSTLNARIWIPGAASKIGGHGSHAREAGTLAVSRGLGFLKAAGSQCSGIAAEGRGIVGSSLQWKIGVGRGGWDSGRRRVVMLGMVENKKRMGISTVVLEEGQERLWHTLPSGLRLEVLLQRASEVAEEEEEEEVVHKRKPALVMVHGSYHAAWCWAVFWMDYFAARGYDCWAVSLLGQGGSDVPPQQEVAGSIQSHARDIADFVHHHCRNDDPPPILIGHSFGGLIVQFYLSQLATMHGDDEEPQNPGEKPYPRIAGAILACSVPPTGNMDVVKRYLRSKPIASIKVTLSLAAKLFASSLSLCRETFFSPSMDDAQVIKYQKLMKESSHIPLFNLRELNATLPIPPPPPSALCPPVLVVGAENDFVLDWQAAEETAAFYGTTPQCVTGVAHDMMLDICWKDAAQVLLQWLEEQQHC
ncbi:hypothetical protein BDL97_18G046400 [Sphagnum fallax]|nr:hypothetical protein BDL97_18G046400 [Sphagnum fallax]